MRKILKEFYFGNIIPYEKRMTVNSNLRRAANNLVRHEKQLTEWLSEEERLVFDEFVKAQSEVDSITAMESFIQGFRLGVRMMVECMDENDGDMIDMTERGE